RWNLVSAQVAIQKEIQVGDPSPEVPALDRFPGLFGILPRDIGLVACSSLLVDVVTDAVKRSDPVDFYLGGITAYYTEGISDHDLLAALSRDLELPLTEPDIDAMLEDGQPGERQAHLERIRNATNVPEKLAAAIGGERLQRRLPTSLIDTVLNRNHTRVLTEVQAGQLAVALYGADVLREYRSELQDAG